MEKQMKKERAGKGLFWLGCAPWIITVLLSLLGLVQGGTAGGMTFFMIIFIGGVISAVWSVLCWVPANILAGKHFPWLKKATIGLAVLLVVPVLVWAVYVLMLGFTAH